MKLTNISFAVHLLVMVSAIAVGYALGGQIDWAFIFVAFGGLWYFAYLRSAQGVETVLFFGFALAAAVGFWIALNPIAMLASLVAALGAWDLDHFAQRLRLVQRVEMTRGLGISHLKRLMVIELLGFLAGLAGLTSSLFLPFWLELLLVVLAVIGISRLVIFVKNTLG